MKCSRIICLLLSISTIQRIGSASSALFSQQYISPQLGIESPAEMYYGGVVFSYDMFNFASYDSGMSRLDVYVAFVNDVLQFYKGEDNSYTSPYELNVSIENRKGIAIAESSEFATIVVPSFEETNSRSSIIRHDLSFDLEPDRYKVIIRLIDLESRQSLERTQDVTVRDFSQDKLHLSDIIFADSIDHDSLDVREIVPNILRTFDSPVSQFRAYYEIYPPAGEDTVRLYNELIDAQGVVVYKNLDTLEVTTAVIKEIINLRNLVDTPGRFELAVRASTEKQRATVLARFFVQWSTVSLVESSLDLAIEQLKYIARREDVDAILKATDNEREMMYNEFWRQRDPTPETDRNELKEEFFRRIDFVNRNFTVLTASMDGWQTDRGKIYIKYGAPTEVQREATEINGPAYEMWYYKSIDTRFYFMDRNGMGDYKLIRTE